MIAAGILLSGVQNLAVDIAMEKSNGTLKRLGGTPLSPVSYFLGKIGQVFVTGTLQAALLILAGWLVLGIELPTEPEKWFTFAWVFVLGLVTCALMGIALSALPRSGKSATAVVIPIVLLLQFISGVYLQWNMLPTGCRTSRASSPSSGSRRACARCSCPRAGRRSSRTGRGTCRGSRSRSASGSSSGSCSAG